MNGKYVNNHDWEMGKANWEKSQGKEMENGTSLYLNKVTYSKLYWKLEVVNFYIKRRKDLKRKVKINSSTKISLLRLSGAVACQVHDI